jgi:hypothetical protein
VLIIAAALWTLQQGRRLQLAADVNIAHSSKESVESLQLEALAAGKSRGGGTTKQTLLLLALTERSGKRDKKAYTFGAHGGTKKLLLAARSWRTNEASSQPALQQHNKISMIALHCVPKKTNPCFSVSVRDPVFCVRKGTFRSVSFKKVLQLFVDVLFGIIPRVDFDCFSTSPDHLARVPSQIFFLQSPAAEARGSLLN